MTWFFDAFFLDSEEELPELPEFKPSGICYRNDDKKCKYFLNGGCTLKGIIFPNDNDKPCFCEDYFQES